MESRRMPLPTARFASTHVDTARNQRSSLAACADPQIHSMLWRGEFKHRQICAHYVQRVQCRNVPGISQKIIAPSLSRQTHGGRAGQRQISPRRVAGAFPAQVPQGVEIVVPAAVQSAARTDRTSLEARPTNRHSQSLLCNTRRSSRCGRKLFQSLAKTQRGAAQIMRHYLRRYV